MEQVDEDLAKAIPISPDRRDSIWQVQHDPETLPLGEEAEPFDRGADDADHVHIVQQQLRGPTFDARQVEQFVDHLDQVACLDLDLGDPVTKSR